MKLIQELQEQNDNLKEEIMELRHQQKVRLPEIKSPIKFRKFKPVEIWILEVLEHINKTRNAV